MEPATSINAFKSKLVGLKIY